MSKMPAKKKSCFQITSVTTAQVASSLTEDTESLDDPDESHTEDVSSEIFDVSRATDYGPEEVCERSSSEETLNNVGDAETPGTVSPNLLLDGQLAAAAAAAAAAGGPANGGGAAVNTRSVASGPAATPLGPSAAPGPQATSSAAGLGSGAASQTTATCSSRFRVIKLDHGSGEPYRRGRWTCMEYYDRDSDSAVLTRTGDCIRHSTTFEPSADRDSGLGATGGSVVVVSAVQATQGSDPGGDGSMGSVSQALQTEKLNPPPVPKSQHFVGQPQPPPQPIGGAVPPGPGQTLYSGPVAANQPVGGGAPQQSQSPGAAPTGVSVGHNGKGQQAPPQQVQPTAAAGTPPQPFAAYPPPPVAPGHLLPTQPPGQTDYMPQHMATLQSQGAVQQGSPAAASSAGTSSLPVGPGSGQNPSSVGAQMVAGPAQAGEMSGQAGLPQSGAVVQPGLGPPKSVTQLQMGGSSGQGAAMPAMVPGGPNVPAAVPGTNVPSVATPSVTMPNVPVTLGQPQLSSHTSGGRSSSGMQQHVGLPLMPGTSNVPASLPQANVSQFQTQTQPLAGQVDDTRRKSEPLPQPPLSLIAENKALVKPPIQDALSNPLLPATTPMNSLASSVFGIAIPVDGDEDSASGASVVAIDNKIEQAMDLVKSHLMYAVREEVEVLKEQIKELVERNSLLERENALLKSLSNNDQLSQLSTHQANPSSTSPQQSAIAQPPQPTQPPQQPNVSSA
ncbi:TSC22 domain family protein 2 isoform X2 [Gracilinanus agilis]|uniref:TSC22 domain family protein 2 isoform X2 n=1 Tax=Gracilinanus agilis TaxID=191870 RepID=UPI001CFE7170|nr:TSC22 domain family protein 2 isoform X2 [Gracilinanus agilis]